MSVNLCICVVYCDVSQSLVAFKTWEDSQLSLNTIWLLAEFCVAVVDRLFHQAYVGFRRFCVESENLPTDLHIVLSDILQDAGLCEKI